MWTKVVFLLAVFAAANALDPINQCKHNPGQPPMDLEVVGCSTWPCVIPQLEYLDINMLFRTPRTLYSMLTLAFAYVSVGPAAIPVPIPLGDAALTCNFLINSYCPVIEGEILMYRLRMLIGPEWPILAVPNIEVWIVDGSNTNSTIMCVNLPIRVAPPLPAQLESAKNMNSNANN